jgi:hypothetical protein
MNSARPSAPGRRPLARTIPADMRRDWRTDRRRILAAWWLTRWNMAWLSCGRMQESGRWSHWSSPAARCLRWCKSPHAHCSATDPRFQPHCAGCQRNVPAKVVIECCAKKRVVTTGSHQTDPNRASCSSQRTQKSSDRGQWFFRFCPRSASHDSPRDQLEKRAIALERVCRSLCAHVLPKCAPTEYPMNCKRAKACRQSQWAHNEQSTDR